MSEREEKAMSVEETEAALGANVRRGRKGRRMRRMAGRNARLAATAAAAAARDVGVGTSQQGPAGDGSSVALDGILDLNEPAHDIDQVVDGLRFLLQKELRNSDVGALGRIVLPKHSQNIAEKLGFQKEAEAHLPVLPSREGISIAMEDLDIAQLWTFKYRFWPNNRSRMYILENTGDFVKFHGLQPGDFVMLYKDDNKDKYIIRAKKDCNHEPPLVPEQDEIFDSIVPDFVVATPRYSDLFIPLADAESFTGAFSADFTTGFQSF